jgi:hypothetical protein
MVSQYPHRCTVLSNENATQGTDGNWTPGASSDPTEKECRWEASKPNAFIDGVDGKRISVQGVVYMPKTEMNIGDSVEVKDGSRVIVKDTIKQVSIGQMNTRIWL